MTKKDKIFLRQPRKYINGWSITRGGSDFGKAGQVVLVYKENGIRRRRTISYEQDWYFYIEKTDQSLAILETFEIGEIKIGNKYIRISFPKTTYNPEKLQALVKGLESQGVKTCEADIGPMKRLCLDYDLQVEDWDNIEILYFDIETDDTKDGISIGRDRILSFGAMDKRGNKYFICEENEQNLLLKVNNLLMKHDMLVGWNSKGFDIPYLLDRMKKNKVNTEYLYNMLHEDMMKRVQYFYSKDPEARQGISSYSLNSISKYFLNQSKIERGGKVIDLMNSDFELFKEYNLRDCELVKNLEEKLGTIRLTYMMFQWCQCFCQNWSMVKTIDNLILSDANKKGIHYRTNLNQMLKDENEPESEFLGAFVLDPIPGYYENVYDLDFKSLYPNIIRTFNISPETHKGDLTFSTGKDESITPTVTTEKETTHGGQVFRNDIIGIIPNKITLLLEEREKIRKDMKGLSKDSNEYKDLNVKQLIVKELANSIYGVLGNRWFRSFSIPLAESITSTGQYLIKYGKRVNEEEGRKAIYGDTDSLFLTLKPGENIEEVLDWLNKKIQDHLVEVYGVKNPTVQMALDTVFPQFIIETKKKYIGKIGDKYKFVGMECIKRDTIPVAVTYQKKLIEKVMNKESLPEIRTWIEEKKENLLTQNYNLEDIVIRKKLTKEVKSYKGKSDRNYTPPIHVRIADRLMKEGKGKGDKTMEYSGGSIIQYVVTKGGTGTKMEAIHISEFKEEWDRNYYWNNLIYPPLEKLLISVFPEEDWKQFYVIIPRKRAKTSLEKVSKKKKISRKLVSDDKGRPSVSRSRRSKQNVDLGL